LTDVTTEPPILLVATTNRGKAHEYATILAGAPVRLLTLADVGIDDDVEETGDSFLANARLKAQGYAAIARARGLHPWVLADDSGLEVDALDGAPGVLSTRWAGPNTTPEGRNTLLLDRLLDVPVGARGARFRCVIVLRSPDGVEYIGDGTVEGQIAFAPRQHPGWGFGYDPLFELPDRGLTLAEIPPAEKDEISHRGRAGVPIRAALIQALAPGAS
jgi:XTP/dITP diphosphohydrolase